MIICVDFDGVIHDHKHPIANKRMGAPMEGAAHKLAVWRDKGFTIIIHSSNNPHIIEEYMKHYNLHYDKIVTKPHADYYIDDKAIKFTNWSDINIL